MLIDHEALLHDLEQYIDSRTSHGRDKLQAKIRELRVQHRVDESLVENAVRLYGPHLSTMIRQTSGERPSGLEPLSGADRPIEDTAKVPKE